MRASFIQHVIAAALLAGCAHQSTIQPAETMDLKTGVTVGALARPLEFVADSPNALLNGKRTSFAYLGPIEWDVSGEPSYALWCHVAPGNDVPVEEIRSPGVVKLILDDGVLPLQVMAGAPRGRVPYVPVASWGQTAFFEVDPAILRKMAASQKLVLDIRSAQAAVDFLPTQETHETLMQFIRARHITGD